MTAAGIYLTLLIGQTVPRPAPPSLLTLLRDVEVTESDDDRTGFQLTFEVGRGDGLDQREYGLVGSPLLQPLNRIILTVALGARPRVLLDGFITHQQLLPGDRPGAGRLIVTGEDISLAMDMEERTASYPAQSTSRIVEAILVRYVRYGLAWEIVPPAADEHPGPSDPVPVQRGTDLQYLQFLAERFGYVFYVEPGPLAGDNLAYWGPPKRRGLPQRALSVNLGPLTNVSSIDFARDNLEPADVRGWIQDAETNRRLPIAADVSTRPSLSRRPAWRTERSRLRTRLPGVTAGLSFAEARARAQARLDRSTDDVVLADGELDTLRYGDALRARRLVGLRGVGVSYDGAYYVKRVTHLIAEGSYRQRFTLARDGMGAMAPLVRP